MASKARTRELFITKYFTVHDASGTFLSTKFNKATGIERTIAIAEYSEGGAHAPMKEPGGVSFGNVTLAKGTSTTNSDFYKYCELSNNMLANLPEGSGELALNLLRDFRVTQRDRKQQARIHHYLIGALPTRHMEATFDNDSDEVQIEELELSIHFGYRKIA